MSATSSPTPRTPRRTGLRLAAAAVPAVLLTGACDAREVYERSLSLGFPQPITDRAESIYELWLGSVAAAVVVGVFVLALILFAVFRYRKRTDELPRQIRYNLPIEVLYTLVPFVIIAVLFYYTTVSQNFVNDLTAEEDGGPDITIGVIGFQWNWTFNYLEGDDPDEVAASVTGTPFQPARLILPTGRTVRFTQTSPDVIHAFWVPEMLFKRDVIPGRVNTYELTFNKEGEYIGRCAEFCGEKHSRMNFSLQIVSPEEYDAFLADLASQPTVEGPAEAATTDADDTEDDGADATALPASRTAGSTS